MKFLVFFFITNAFIISGKPTLAACKKIGKKNKLKNEVAELDRENIICDSGKS